MRQTCDKPATNTQSLSQKFFLRVMCEAKKKVSACHVSVVQQYSYFLDVPGGFQIDLNVIGELIDIAVDGIQNPSAIFLRIEIFASMNLTVTQYDMTVTRR